MKTAGLMSGGRASSKTPASTSAAAFRDRPEGGRGAGSCYYPGCRKDTNCHCDICLASINATRDLISSASSIIHQKSSLTKLSASEPSAAPRFLPFSSSSSPSQTPSRSETGSAPSSPLLRSTAKSRRSGIKVATQKGVGVPRALLWCLLRCVTWVCLVFAADYGFPVAIRGILGGQMLSAEMVKMAGEEAQIAGDLRGKMASLQGYLRRVVGAERISNCSDRSSWEFHQEGNLFRARCMIYKSLVEELSIWGCPIETSGLLIARFAPRWFVVLSGRIAEWSEEKLAFTSRAGNSSWAYSKWTTSVIHLDRNTWVLEYQSSSLQNTRLLPLLWEFFRMKLSRKIMELQHSSSQLPLFFHNSNSDVLENLPQPT